MTDTIEHLEALVADAAVAIDRATLLAETDRTRPAYHFRAPAQWMDDPNGIIFHEGWYHMMYSLNPHSSEQRAGMVYKTAVRVWDPASDDWTGGITVWGHARSRDLVHWEHLPIAIYPAVDVGEHFIWFGCTVINGLGQPMAIYTAVGPDLRPEDTAQQWAAIGTPDFIDWKPAASPLLDYDVHGGQIITEWRDPFLFSTNGRTFMVIGGRDQEGVPVVALYEALSEDFLKWTYRGIVFTHPESSFPSIECPNLFQIGEDWVLLLSPHGAVEYFIGRFDADAGTFEWRTRGTVDHSTNFYATNVLKDDRGRWVMWGALVGFTESLGWNGCVSLPRVIEIDDGRLVQRVAPELEVLRSHAVATRFDVLPPVRALVDRIETSGTLELHAILRPTGAYVVTVDLLGDDGSIQISLGNDVLRVGDRDFRVAGRAGERELRVFLDRTVIEVYLDDTDVATCVIPHVDGAVSVYASAEGDDAVEAELTIWKLRADGLFSGSVLRRGE